MAQHKSESIAIGSSANCLANQAPVWIAPYLVSGRPAGLFFAFHDGKEIGPHILARLAKKTGLRSEGLWHPFKLSMLAFGIASSRFCYSSVLGS
jgi:hypothetical protein